MYSYQVHSWSLPDQVEDKLWADQGIYFPGLHITLRFEATGDSITLCSLIKFPLVIFPEACFVC